MNHNMCKWYEKISFGKEKLEIKKTCSKFNMAQSGYGNRCLILNCSRLEIILFFGIFHSYTIQYNTNNISYKIWNSFAIELFNIIHIHTML